MTFIPPVSAGTIDLANGSTNVTGFGTNFLSAGAKGGDILVIGVTRVEIQEVVSNTNLELLLPWDDADVSGGDFYIVSRNAETLAAENATEVRRLLQQIRTGLLSRPDAFGSLSDRDQFNSEPAGFIYHVLDEASQAVVGYYKTGDGTSDWSVGISLRGEPGLDGLDGQAFNHQGNGVPPASLGSDGQTYLRTSNFDVYENNGGTWTVISNILTPIQNALSSQFSALEARFDGVEAVNGKLVGGFGGTSGGGVLDWDDDSNIRAGSGFTLLRGNALNGPMIGHPQGATFFHAFNFEFASSGNITQFAIPYLSAGFVFFRVLFQGTWTAWRQFNDDRDLRSSFYVTGVAQPSATSGIYSIGQAGSKIVDNDNNFNTSTGRFTAREDGLYEFDAQIVTGSEVDGHFNLTFFRNNIQVGFPALEYSNFFSSLVNSIMIDLVAGDFVEARISRLNNRQATVRNSFFKGKIIRRRQF